MGKRIGGRLTALQVARANKRGLLNDGLGLNLQIAENGSKSWTLRFTFAGRSRYLGLGPLHTVSLAEARERAAAARLLILSGTDPVTHRRAARAAIRAAEARLKTFDEVAEEYIKTQEPSWKNKKLAALWRSTLRTYASPIIGRLAVSEIDVGLVCQILRPLWHTKPETADRVRMRLAAILGSAATQKLRDKENPAEWRGNLENILPPLTKNVVNHAALDYAVLPIFVSQLRTRDAIAAKALEFLILCASRTGEVLGARWNEIDLGRRLWIVPPARMKRARNKAPREHRVVLSDAALELLVDLSVVRDGDGLIFPGARAGQPLSNMALLILMQRRMGYSEATPHGMRAAFKTWATEQTDHAREMIEMALAHVVGSDVEQAYQRGDAVEKRRRLMNDWAAFCDGFENAGVNVVPLKREA